MLKAPSRREDINGIVSLVGVKLISNIILTGTLSGKICINVIDLIMIIIALSPINSEY